MDKNKQELVTHSINFFEIISKIFIFVKKYFLMIWK